MASSKSSYAVDQAEALDETFLPSDKLAGRSCALLTPAARMDKVAYPIRDIVLKARQVQATGIPMHWFNIGDPNKFDFAPPPWVTKAIVDALGDSRFSAYAPSDGDPDLRETIAKNEGIEPEKVFITSGLTEGLYFAFQCLLEPGQHILLPAPTYPLYSTISRMFDGDNTYYKSDAQWQPDIDDMRKRINSKTRAIVLINPNNPTGAVYPRSTIKAVADLAGEHCLPLIADEIYDKLVFGEPLTPVHKIAGADIPVIRGNGLSKNFFYPGSRVGYLALHGPRLEKIIPDLNRLCNSRLSVNWEMQRGALAAFSQPPSHLPAALVKLRARRDLMAKRLNNIPGIRTTTPQAAFYIFPEVTDGPWANDTEFIYDLMENTGIVGVPGSGFSPEREGRFFRLVYLAHEDEINAAMDKLEAFMKKRLA